MRLSFAQRVVAVVAFGAMCLATGGFVAATYGPHQAVAFGWTAYAPLSRVTFDGPAPRPLDSAEVLGVWLGLAALWCVVSMLLCSRRAPGRSSAPGTASGESGSPDVPSR